MTTYNPVIPQPGDLISNSQADILGNFTQLNAQYGIDHVAFNTGSGNGSGFHKQVTIPTPLGSDPTLTSNTGEFYTKQVSAVTFPFFANASTVWQLAGKKLAASNGYTTLPGGFLMQWGNYQITGSGTSTSVTFPIAFSTSIYAVVSMPINVGGFNVQNNIAGATSTGTTGFTAVRPSTSGTAIYNYIAIGI